MGRRLLELTCQVGFRSDAYRVLGHASVLLRSCM